MDQEKVIELAAENALSIAERHAAEDPKNQIDTIVEIARTDCCRMFKEHGIDTNQTGLALETKLAEEIGNQLEQ